MSSKLTSATTTAHKSSSSLPHNPTSASETVYGGDKSIMKVSCKTAPKGEMGQKYLAAGIHMGMRMWENEPTSTPTAVSHRDYETLGFVLRGKAELLLEGQTILLEEGDSWLVPKGSGHAYRILESFSAIETTSPCGFAKGRDHAAH